MELRRHSRPPASRSRVDGAPPVSTAGRRVRRPTRLVAWRRRHLNLRTVIALIALSSLLAPGAAAIIDAAL